MDSSSAFLASILAIVLSSSVAGQSSVLLMDDSSGPVVIQSFRDLDARDDGDWYALVDAFVPQNDLQLLRSGTLLRAEGDGVSVPGAAIRSFVDVGQSERCPQPYLGILELMNDADPGTPPAVTDADDRGLFWGQELLLREGDLATAPEVAPGTRIVRLIRSCSNSKQDCLLLTEMDDPTIAGTESALLIVDLDAGCGATPAVVAQHVPFRTGSTLPISSSTLSAFGSEEKRSFDFNARGDWIFVGAFDSPHDRRVVLNGRVVLAESKLIPGGKGAATSLQLAAVDLDDQGNFIIQTRGAAAAALVKGNALQPLARTMFIQACGPVPDASIPHSLLRIGASVRFGNSASANWTPALLTNGGDVVWYGEWDGGTQQSPSPQAGIFVNRKLLVRTGSVQAGTLIDHLGSPDGRMRFAFEVSPNGRYLIYQAEAGAPLFAQGVFRMDLGEAVPYGRIAEGCGGGTARLQREAGADGLPLVDGRVFGVRTGPPPSGTTSITLCFTPEPPASYPCGTVIPCAACANPLNFLLGGGTRFQVTQPASQPLFTFQLSDPRLIGLVSYGQAFFVGPGGLLGESTGMRFVFGAP